MSTPDERTPPLARPIDALTAVRSHPEWYFRGQVFDSREALALMTDEAVAHGASDLLVQQIDEWWVLASSGDWLAGDLGAFFSPVPDPTRGPNTARVEVLLTAFCESVWTAATGQSFDVSGKILPPEQVRALLEARHWARVVAFLPPRPSGANQAGESQPTRHLKLVPDDLSPAYDEALAKLPGKIEEVRRPHGTET